MTDTNDCATIRQRAKERIRYWLAQSDLAKRSFREGKITKEEWLDKKRKNDIRIKSVQSLFQ